MEITILDPAEWPADCQFALQWGEGETCAVLLGRKTATGWEVSQPYAVDNAWAGDRANNFTISTAGFREARTWAKAHSLCVIGHAHTHLSGSSLPSEQDLRFLRAGELGMVWDLPSATCTWYAKSGPIRTEPLPLDAEGLTAPDATVTATAAALPEALTDTAARTT